MFLQKGHAPIHIACNGTNKEVLKLLLDYGADLNVIDNNRLKPIHYASIRGDKNIIEFLVKHGADPKENSPRGTPLKFASDNHHTDVIKWLKSRGAIF